MQGKRLTITSGAVFAVIGFAALVYVVHSFPASAGTGIEVVTTILPFKEFVEGVGGERVEVSILIPPGANPHTYELTPSQLKLVSRARMYVKVGSGIEFEQVWTGKIAGLNKDMLVCNSCEGLSLIEMEESNCRNDDDAQHSTRSKAERHDYHGKDPHVWLSPRNARDIVGNIKECLIQIDPGNSETYVTNARNYINRLDALDEEIQGKLFGLKGKPFMVFHPAWGYFARDYNLNQIAIEVQGKEPSPRQISKAIETARRFGIKTILVSPSIDPKTAVVVANEIDGEVVLADPLAQRYIDNLGEVANLISRTYE